MKCIDDSGYYLTKGKYYEILYTDASKGFVTVINDIGRPSEYSIKAFEGGNNEM